MSDPIVKKKKMGRPSKLDNMSNQLKKQLKMLYVRCGFTDQEAADFLGVTITTIAHWKMRDAKFFATLKDWKAEADQKVEKCLYQRAIGYEYDEITYEKSKIGGLAIGVTAGEISDIKHSDVCKTKITTKIYPPDVTAQIFWLKNRQPKQWREKQKDEEESFDPKKINITVINTGKNGVVKHEGSNGNGNGNGQRHIKVKS